MSLKNKKDSNISKAFTTYFASPKLYDFHLNYKTFII